MTYGEFMKFAKECKAYTILETWDENSFNFYVEEFGTMTKERAIDLCFFTEEMTEEEEKAGRYFADNCDDDMGFDPYLGCYTDDC